MNPEIDTKNDEAKTSQMVVFKVSDEIFATDINKIREVIKFGEVTPVPDSNDYIAGIVNIRGKIVPVIDLGVILKIGTNRANPQSYIILIDGPDNSVIGMLVDDVTEIRHFTADEIKPAPKLVKSKVESEFIAGVILPENSQNEDKVILLVDLEAIINKSVIQVVDQVKLSQQQSIKNPKEKS